MLLTISERLPAARRSFGRVLDGGAVATLYITGFAAYQLYSLTPHGVAFAFLVGVTLLALWLSLRSDDAALAVIGVAGGLATPFLLHEEGGSVPGLVAYTCIVLAGAGVIHLRRGWRALLLTSAAGGWLVLGLAISEAGGPSRDPTPERVALQLGIAFAGLVFWGLPLLRALRRGAAGNEPATASEAYVSALSTPLIALALSSALWERSRDEWGWIALGLGGALALAAVLLARAARGREQAPAQALAAFVLATVAFALLLEGSWLVVALAAEGLGLHVLARRARDPLATLGAHVLFAVAGFAVAERMLAGEVEAPRFVSGQSLSDLFVIFAAALASTRLGVRAYAAVYRLCAHVALLGWMARELSGLENGQGLVTLAWGAWALALLVIGLRRDAGELRSAGSVTLFVVVGKLFLVDLREVETLWRILSFLGFGAAFLALSYWMRALWKPKGNEE